MKKLLGLALSVAFVCVLGVGMTGCTGTKDKTAPADTKKGLSASTPEAVKIKVGDTKDVTVTYTVGSDAKLKTIAAASDNDKVAKVTVTPDKLDKTGPATVKVEGISEGTAKITVTGSGEGTTPATVTTTISVTVEKK